MIVSIVGKLGIKLQIQRIGKGEDMCFAEFWVLITIAILAVTCSSALWDWVNDKKYNPLLYKALKTNTNDKINLWLECKLTAIVCVILGFCLQIWFITVPIAAIVGGAYYARYYIRQKNKEPE